MDRGRGVSGALQAGEAQLSKGLRVCVCDRCRNPILPSRAAAVSWPPPLHVGRSLPPPQTEQTRAAAAWHPFTYSSRRPAFERRLLEAGRVGQRRDRIQRPTV